MSHIPTVSAPPPRPTADSLWSGPNLISLSRLPLAAALFAAIALKGWWTALAILILIAASDWLDGWLARRTGRVSVIGRSLDPLTDKVANCGAFIFLIRVDQAGIDPWMTTVIVARELLVTGLRGLMETAGIDFGADWSGKWKTALQFAVLVAIFLMLGTHGQPEQPGEREWLAVAVTGLIWLMLLATIGSGIHYIFKAINALQRVSLAGAIGNGHDGDAPKQREN